ncbi:MAG: hypothetical protein ACOYXR_06745 [Nitrospirota bacterium]
MTTPDTRWGVLGAVLAVFWALVWTAPGVGAFDTAHAGEAPLNAAIHDLVEHPDQYDGRLVLVTGYVGHIAWERGRRGSEYVELRLDEAGTEAGATETSVTVIAWLAPTVRECQQVLVQGTYHRTGKQAGRPYEFFIDADAVLRDVPDGSGRVPRACEKKL